MTGRIAAKGVDGAREVLVVLAVGAAGLALAATLALLAGGAGSVGPARVKPPAQLVDVRASGPDAIDH